MNFENLPETWKVVRLGKIAKLRYGKTLTQEEFTERGYPVFGANGIIGFYKEYLYEEPQVLISCRGAYSGVINLSPPKVFVTNNSIVVDISKNLHMINKLYLFYYLRYLGRDKLTSGTAQPQVTIENIFNLPIHLPPLPEQKRIAEILSLAEDLIRKQKEAIALIDKILMAKFLEMFGDPATNPKGWEVKRLREVADIHQGKTPRNSDYLDDGMHKILKVRDLNEDGTINWSIHEKGFISENSISSYENYKVMERDILFTASAHSPEHIGKKIAIVDFLPSWFKGVYHVAELIRVRTYTYQLDPFYLFFFLSSEEGYKLIQDQIQGVHVYPKDLANLLIPLPPIDLQQQFTRIVEEFEKKRQEMQKTLETLESLFKLLQKKAFTGDLTAEWREKNNVDWELPKITERQAILLAVIYYHQNLIQKPAMVTVVMKSAFLLQQEAGLNLNYDFIPYKYGPFSKEVYEDIEKLEKNLLVERVKPKKDAEMTEIKMIDEFKDRAESIIKTLPQEIKETIKSYTEKYGRMELNKLLDYVYDKYPKYAVKSKRKKGRSER